MTIALTAVAALAVLDLTWVALRVRREWSRSDELSPLAAVGISSLYLLAIALIVLAILIRPWPISLPLAVAIPAGAVLVLGGLLLTVIGARPFGSSARLYGVETGGLVEGGVYELSRNPQYAGLLLSVVGVALLARSGLTLAVAAFLGGAFWLWVVAVEEPHLAETFGNRYERYRRRTPRFIGIVPH